MMKKPKSFSSYGKSSNRNPKHGKSTVNWAGMTTHRFREAHKKIHLTKLAEVQAYFDANTIPDNITPWPGSFIGSVAKFIEGHTARVEGLAGRANLAGPYLRRLILLMEWSEKNPIIEDIAL